MRLYEEDTLGIHLTNPGLAPKQIANDQTKDNTDEATYPTEIEEETETEMGFSGPGMESFSDEVLKESVIASMSQYSFESSLEFLASESRGSDTSLINAFEASHSYYRVFNSLQ